MVEPDSSSAFQSCTDMIGDEFSYLHNFKSNFEYLRAQVEKLTHVKQRADYKIEVARRNGEAVEDDVSKWQREAHFLIYEARDIIEHEREGKLKCFGGLCPNLAIRHEISKQAARVVKEVVLLLSQGEKILEISFRPIPAEISIVIISSQNPFVSLRNCKRYYENLVTEFEKLMDARQRVRHMMKVSRRNGEAIYEDVLKWVTNVDELVDDTRTTLEGFYQKANTRCFIGLCPDLITRYHLSNRVVRQLKAVAELRAEGVFDKVSYTIIPPNIWLTSTKVYETFASRISTLEDLYHTLEEFYVNTIGLLGMGGTGKTVLAKQVAARVESLKLFDVVIFAEVTPTPDLKRIQEDIAGQLGLMFREEDVDGRAIRLFNRLKREQRILVILDNIWTCLDLRRVGIPVGDDHWRSKVLLTSRNKDVLSDMGSQRDFKVGVLHEEEAFNFFKKMAGVSVENQELESLAVDVAKACGGLPIAIASVAMALRGKDVFTWRNALRNLERPSFSNLAGMLGDAYSSIELSYHYLNSKELKSTLLLCSLMKYSGDAPIMELLKYGLGLGLFKEIRTLEEVRNRVYALVHELKSSCLLLDSHSSEWFSVHNVVHLVVISIASRNQYALTLRNEDLDWLDKDAFRNYVAISIYDNNIRELPEGLKCPQLSFFNLIARNSLIKISVNFFTGMTNLSVLNLTRMHLLTLPSSLCLLVNLRTLCLEKCILGNIAGVGVLKKLEILSLSHSDVKLLPKNIGQLTQLRMLDLSNCSKLKAISPNVISSLTNLEELYMGNSFVQWEVEGLNFKGRNASLNELKHLSELTSLEIHIKDTRIVPRDLFSNKLKRYRIFIGDEWDWFGEYETSRTLKLKCHAGILEYGIIRKLNGIEELYLNELQGVNNVLYDFDVEGFPQLKHLHIENNSSFQCIVDAKDDGVAFPCLKSLFLNNLINLEKVFHGQFTLASCCKLKILKVHKCDKLKNIFSFFIAEGLQPLQTLEVIDCKGLEEIFVNEYEDDIDNKEVNIRFLTLKSLPKLRSSCLSRSDTIGFLEDALDLDMPLIERVI